MSQAPPPEYVLYLRKSNGRKAVPRQRAITSAYIRDLGGVIVAEFKDDDRTAWHGQGERPERDDFDRMLALLRSRKALRVAAWHADRLTRNDHDTAELIRVCKAGSHLIETPRGGTYDMANANGRKRFRDDASDAIYEVDHLQERVLAGRDDVAAEGRWLGGKRPFGWRLDEHPVDGDGEPLLDEDGKPVNGVLVLVDAEASAIRDACDAVLNRATLGGIARQWNAAGLTGTLGAKFSAREVGRILKRPRNAALMEHRGQVTGKASWPAIVDEDTWRRVCAVLADPARTTSPGPERRHLLSGLAKCSRCGEGLVCSTTGSGRGARRVYVCRHRDGDGGHVARGAPALDAYIADIVVERLSRPDAAMLHVPDRAAERAALYQRKAEVETAMRVSNDLRRRQLLTPAEFADERRDHLERLAAISSAISAAEESDVLAPMLGGDAERTWQDAGLEQRRAVIDVLMAITVHPQGKGRPRGWTPGAPYFDPDTVEIRWRT